MSKVKPDKEHGLPSLSLVFGYIAVKELQDKIEQVGVLSRLGYGTAEIARICDTTPESVRVLKSVGKKKVRRRARKRKKTR